MEWLSDPLNRAISLGALGMLFIITGAVIFIAQGVRTRTAEQINASRRLFQRFLVLAGLFMLISLVIWSLQPGSLAVFDPQGPVVEHMATIGVWIALPLGVPLIIIGAIVRVLALDPLMQRRRFIAWMLMIAGVVYMLGGLIIWLVLYLGLHPYE